MADKAYNAFFDVQFRKLGLMENQLKASEENVKAIEGVSVKIDALKFPGSIETKLDTHAGAQLEAAAQALGGIRSELVNLGQQIASQPQWPGELSGAAAYILIWLAQLRSQVLLDTTAPITVASTNSKLMTLRDDQNRDGRYRRSLDLLDSHSELAAEFKKLFEDIDDKTVDDQMIAIQLGARLLELMKLEWHIVSEVTDPLSANFEPAPLATSTSPTGSSRGSRRSSSSSST